MVKIASWNVDPVKARLLHLPAWLKAALPVVAALVLGAVLASAATAHHEESAKAKSPAESHTKPAAKSPAKPAAKSGTRKRTKLRLAMPMMNPERGMYLFASKGCVTCHAINGVGGHDATKLDAHTMDRVMNPFELVAKMWRMAPAMIAAQEEVLGHQILFSGEEIADIIAFVHDDNQQHEFTGAMVPPDVKKMMDHVHAPQPGHQKELGHGRPR